MSGRLRIRDHRPGDPGRRPAHVFDRFYRGTTARGRPDSGLGLAIVRQVVETHGGTITVQEGAGGGAMFRLRLAALDAESEPERAGDAAEPAPATPQA